MHSGFLNEMRGRVQTLFQAPLSADDIQVQGRRQLPGQRIGVHNDSPGLGDEGYRVVLQFTHDLSPEDGGLFNIHAGDDPEAICQSIRPYPNLAVGFEMGAQSYHSVTPPTRQPRAALIFNFWHQGNSPVVARRVRQALATLLPDVARLEEEGPANWPAPRAQALLAEWCMGNAAQAAGLLLAAAAASETVRSPGIDKALARLGFPAGAPLPSGEAILAAAQAHAGLNSDPDTLRAALALAVWVAGAPSRIFSHEHWSRCAAQVRPGRTACRYARCIWPRPCFRSGRGPVRFEPALAAGLQRLMAAWSSGVIATRTAAKSRSRGTPSRACTEMPCNCTA